MAGEYVLLVEGPDDSHVLYHLSKYYGVAESFLIKHKDGIDNLLITLDVELLRSDLKRLGVIVDADTNLVARWQALRDILTHSGYIMPTAPTPDGTIIHREGLPTVGVWLMPNNVLPGMLENFIEFLVPQRDRLWSQAKECVEQLPEGDRRFPPDHKVKAYVHTWLAWQEEPGKPLGQAITKRYLDAEAQHARQLMDWLRRLFDLGA